MTGPQPIFYRYAGVKSTSSKTRKKTKVSFFTTLTIRPQHTTENGEHSLFPLISRILKYFLVLKSCEKSLFDGKNPACYVQTWQSWTCNKSFMNGYFRDARSRGELAGPCPAPMPTVALQIPCQALACQAGLPASLDVSKASGLWEVRRPQGHAVLMGGTAPFYAKPSARGGSISPHLHVPCEDECYSEIHGGIAEATASSRYCAGRRFVNYFDFTKQTSSKAELLPKRVETVCLICSSVSCWRFLQCTRFLQGFQITSDDSGCGSFFDGTW